MGHGLEGLTPGLVFYPRSAGLTYETVVACIVRFLRALFWRSM